MRPFKPDTTSNMPDPGTSTSITTKFNQHYYVTQDGQAITKPMTGAEIVSKFGPIRELEANGFRVVPA